MSRAKIKKYVRSGRFHLILGHIPEAVRNFCNAYALGSTENDVKFWYISDKIREALMDESESSFIVFWDDFTRHLPHKAIKSICNNDMMYSKRACEDGNYSLEKGRYRDALEYYKRSYIASHNNEALFGIAYACLKSMKLDECLKICDLYDKEYSDHLVEKCKLKANYFLEEKKIRDTQSSNTIQSVRDYLNPKLPLQTVSDVFIQSEPENAYSITDIIFDMSDVIPVAIQSNTLTKDLILRRINSFKVHKEYDHRNSTHYFYKKTRYVDAFRIKCDKCDEKTTVRLAHLPGSGDIDTIKSNIEYYKRIITQIRSLGYRAEIKCYCPECQKDLFPNASVYSNMFYLEFYANGEIIPTRTPLDLPNNKIGDEQLYMAVELLSGENIVEKHKDDSSLNIVQVCNRIKELLIGV